jgi:molybdopterin-containing oxidoreductase family membrane subunit
MAEERKMVTGLFKDDGRAAEAISAIKERGWRLKDVHGPIPSEAITDAMGQKKTGVGWFTLAGGIIGFFTGYLLASLTAARWELIVSGKPVLAYIPFFIVGFEFTILFSVFGNVVGMILLMRLPAYRDLSVYDPRCSGEYFGVVVGCSAGEAPEVKRFFTEKGAEVA